MLIIVIVVGRMPMPVVQVVQMTVVLGGLMAAARTVLMVVLMINGHVIGPGIIGVNRRSMFWADRHVLLLVLFNFLLRAALLPAQEDRHLRQASLRSQHGLR